MGDNLISVEQDHALRAEEAKRGNKYCAVAVLDETDGRFDGNDDRKVGSSPAFGR